MAALRRCVTGLGILLLGSLGVAMIPTVAGADVEGLTFTATIDERPIDDADRNDPLRLRPDREPVVSLEVTNDSDEDVFVRSVRLDSQVVGLTFFTFTTRIDLELPAGETGEREFAIDLGDLDSQATGLLPGRLSLLDADREVLASESFPVDVRGSLRSVYGMFGIIVALITAVLLVAALVRLAAGRLPANRWGRAARFATPGIGVGLTLTFTLSVLRIMLPSAGLWLTLIIVGGLAGLGLGYLTPAPGDGDEDDDDDDERLLEDDDDLEPVSSSSTSTAGAESGRPGVTRPGGEPPTIR